MTQTTDLTQALAPVAGDQLMAALLNITGDLDKAQVLHDTLPAWLVKADSHVLQAIEQAYADSERPRETLHRVLNRLQPLDKFCAERLRAFLDDKGHGGLDIENDTLEIPRRSFSGVSQDLGGQMIETVNLEKHSLLQAAMQNFSQAAAEPGGSPTTAVVRIGPTRRIAQTLSAQAFIGYCRELNLGEAYQTHVREVFNLVAPDQDFNPSVTQVGQSRCVDMQIDLHLAHAKGDIDASTRALLLGLVKADMPARDIRQLWFNQQPLTWQGLNIDGACLWGYWCFPVRRPKGSPAARSWCICPTNPCGRGTAMNHWSISSSTSPSSFTSALIAISSRVTWMSPSGSVFSSVLTRRKSSCGWRRSRSRVSCRRSFSMPASARSSWMRGYWRFPMPRPMTTRVASVSRITWMSA
ncbi:dermonecrotic toxin domain-containing protein [Pseudomonas sp. NIBRBAC000502773]|uniref:dermonecrotic toxin domain-containing protein n=1 Tax=Pseudomonas sp. NIBRBAC000502773 TaxID=2590776 RepID=UPI00211EEA10